jgi:hypothetical protein
MNILYLLMTILIIFIFINKTKFEHYDTLKRNTNINDCAFMCKTTAGCAGFAFNRENSNCYLSQDLIIGKPLNSLFKEDYNTQNTTCNKYKPIEEATRSPTFDERRSNSLYICTETSTLFPQYYYHYNNTFKNIGEGKNIDEIFDVDNYSVNAFTWPNRYVDNNSELAVLRDGLKTQNYNASTISDIEKILLDENKPKIDIKKDTKSQNNPLKDIKSDITNFFTKMISPDYIPYEKRDIPKTNRNLIYQTNNKLNKGEYLKPFKCVKNIKKEDCLKECTRNPECVGVEWNPEFDGFNNICCPYKTIGRFENRDINTKNGAFYEKIRYSNLDQDKQNIYVKVL